ncbi:MAG: thiazole synthase [Planctomycetes bacterium RBG_16_59_8]|nr:MAG: thiazole synthase [Planctomycetes bacterium RBG_16_59_8]
MDEKKLTIGRHEFSSRLLLGTGKYRSNGEMVKALEASGTECVTVAVRRVDLNDKSDKSFLNHIDRRRYKILPNTAACYTADDAVRTALLAREAGMSDMVKLEVIGDEKTLYPDLSALLEATKILVKEGFTVLPYTSDDLITALRLQDAGAACVMPLGSPIGSGMGLLNPTNIKIIIDRMKVPVIVDAGVGTASDAAIAMELGADGILMNTGIALAEDSARMARAMKLACEAGRDAYLAGRMAKKPYASPSSPTAGKVGG